MSAQTGARPANPVRGETALRVNGTELTLRPSFAALVAAEQELGPLFTLVERAAEGRIGIAETVALLWHCLRDAPAHVTREALGEAIVQGGLAAATPILRALLGQILSGQDLARR
ncbi:gene transfer agent family protein [Sphingomonas sp. CROZ-RG-20F-R02-07]|uniref:gene transfer agent family protein n=1 Tax=Sphingomonas sp. CROZ-RG-20F-R02-07 TaxID=2914832 RepID=UPI001F57CB0D|nr:gene transfer agent family protein [Sphingomonas sp. CROZ-RG-20F-R02-07]